MKSDDYRELCRLQILEAAEALTKKAEACGLVITIDTSILPIGESRGGRMYEVDVRHARGFYPKEK